MMENERKDIRTLSRKYPKLQTLIAYVNKDSLLEEHGKQSNKKASGVDGESKERYSQNLEANIDDLLKRMKTFSYHPKATRRVYIPKSNGKLRPLGIPSYEDKLVQGVMGHVLNEVYEPRFLDCSYGFRENRSCHDAIRAVNQTIMTKKVNYILEADIKGFFDNVNQEWLMKFLENDIEDKNFLRYIVRFLKAGILEDMKYLESDKGTPQGSLISPVLANVYLHYVLDLWFNLSVKKNLKGEAHLVRYADDFLILVQYEEEAKVIFNALIERMAKFGLELEMSKTRILSFGRYKGTKENFDFLGFTFINGTSRKNKFRVVVKTSKNKLKQKKQNAKKWLLEKMHAPVGETIKLLRLKMIGHYNYYGVNGNYSNLLTFYKYVKFHYRFILNRRHQKVNISKEKFNRIWNFYIPKPKLRVNIWSV